MLKALTERLFPYALIALFSASLTACGGGGGEGTVAAASAAAPLAGATTSASGSAGSPASTAVASSPASSSGSGAVTSSPTIIPPAAPATASIDYYGDSTIWGYESGVGTQVQYPEPAVFQQSLPQYKLPTQYTVRNEGVTATTACQLLNGTDGKHPAWDTQMTNSDASIVIINHAINDQAYETPAQYAACITSLVQKAKQHGKTVILETPNPTTDSGPNGLDIWVDAMRNVAAQENIKLIDEYKYLTDYLAGADVHTICPDGTHPTDAVYRMKGEYAARAFATT
jgi:lysophospholipase L1-like esterase